MFSKKILVLAVLMFSHTSYAWSDRAKFPCLHPEDGAIAIILTPVRPYGIPHKVDLEKAQARCEILEGSLGERIIERNTRPPGAR